MNKNQNQAFRSWQERDTLIFNDADLSKYVPSGVREFTNLSPTLIPRIIALESEFQTNQDFANDLLLHYGIYSQLLELEPKLEVSFHGYCTAPSRTDYQTRITDLVVIAPENTVLSKAVWQFLLQQFASVCLEVCDIRDDWAHFNWS